VCQSGIIYEIRVLALRWGEFLKIMVLNLPNLTKHYKNTDLRRSKAHVEKNNQKRIIIKFLKIGNKEKILNMAQEKGQVA
jgi:hypothetical protein